MQVLSDFGGNRYPTHSILAEGTLSKFSLVCYKPTAFHLILSEWEGHYYRRGKKLQRDQCMFSQLREPKKMAYKRKHGTFMLRETRTLKVKRKLEHSKNWDKRNENGAPGSKFHSWKTTATIQRRRGVFPCAKPSYMEEESTTSLCSRPHQKIYIKFETNPSTSTKHQRTNLSPSNNTSHHLTIEEGDQGRTGYVPVQWENKKKCRGNDHAGRPCSQKKMTGNVELGFRKEGIGESKAGTWNPCVPALVFKLFRFLFFILSFCL
jgi:hypothetical protein